MGSLFRGEEMCLAQLFLQAGTAYQCVAELGERALVEFRDLNPNVNMFQRRFVGEIRRCDDLERTFSYLEEEVRRAGLSLSLGEGVELGAPAPRDVLEIQENSAQLQQELRQVQGNCQSLRNRLIDMVRHREVLRETQPFMAQRTMESPPMVRRSLSDHDPLLDPSVSHNLESKLSFVAGVIHPWKVTAFERLLWRACSGYLIANFVEIPDTMEDPVSDESLKPVAFLISYWGEQIGQKVKKICDCYHCHMVPYPSTLQEQSHRLEELATQIQDLRLVLTQSEEYRRQTLEKVVRVLAPWMVRIRKMKAIYLVLNQCNFDITGKCLIAEVWCPRADLQLLQGALERGSRKAGATVPSFYTQIPTNQSPPTLNRTNQFTAGFQSIVDAYGVGSYQEVNPAVYTIITFPFLFAVMFGDVGHGGIMFLFALWMVLNQEDPKLRKDPNEIWRMFFEGRYLILLMGLFSIYTGLIYNDCFSLSLAPGPSAWHVQPMIDHVWSPADLRGVAYLSLDPNISEVFQGVYPFGIDPIWHLANNKLNFLNSFKMKMSVILGIVHMSFGVILSVFNYIHLKRPWLILLVFVPEILFLWCLFGYLVFLIVYKWMVFTVESSEYAPSLLIHFIDMFLFTTARGNMDLFHGQHSVQIVLVVVALLTVPVLLLGKPLYLYYQHKRIHFTRPGGYRSLSDETEHSVNQVVTDRDCEDGNHPEDFDVADVLMKQAIHTIEYCLSCISNTASYLRLWALSLAHAQLSEVLWNMVLRQGFRKTDYMWSVFLFVCFGFFAVLTVAILLVMEGLSAFLHALRLHWVEFQNKFYTGSGYRFIPFSFCHLDHQIETP